MVQEWAEAGRLVRLTPLEAEPYQKSREQWYATPERYREMFQYNQDGKQLVFA